jgi:hypothetical protein
MQTYSWERELFFRRARVESAAVIRVSFLGESHFLTIDPHGSLDFFDVTKQTLSETKYVKARSVIRSTNNGFCVQTD